MNNIFCSFFGKEKEEYDLETKYKEKYKMDKNIWKDQDYWSLCLKDPTRIVIILKCNCISVEIRGSYIDKP